MNANNHSLITLQPLPRGIDAAQPIYSPLAHIDEHSIVFAPHGYHRVFSYDIRTDEWKQLLIGIYLMYTRGDWINIAHDPDTNTLFFERWNNLLVYNKDNESVIERRQIPGKTGSFDYHMHCIDGNLHFICGSEGRHSLVKPGPNHQVLKFDIGCGCISRGTSVHFPTRNMILLIGGVNVVIASDGKNIEGVQSALYKGLKQNHGTQSSTDVDWKWEKLDTNAPGMVALNAVVTSDEKFVIISEVSMGHRNPNTNGESENVEYIYVLDIEDNFRWRQTSIQTPLRAEAISGKQMMFRTGCGYKIDTIVSGFVRRFYQTEKFKNVHPIPEVLVNLIGTYYPQELIHWVTNNSHVAIPLQEILCTVSH